MAQPCRIVTVEGKEVSAQLYRFKFEALGHNVGIAALNEKVV